MTVENETVSSDIKLLATRMEEGFKRIDSRLEANELRFNRLTGLISLGFIVVTVLITVYQFLT